MKYTYQSILILDLRLRSFIQTKKRKGKGREEEIVVWHPQQNLLACKKLAMLFFSSFSLSFFNLSPLVKFIFIKHIEHNSHLPQLKQAIIRYRIQLPHTINTNSTPATGTATKNDERKHSEEKEIIGLHKNQALCQTANPPRQLLPVLLLSPLGEPPLHPPKTTHAHLAKFITWH